MYVIKVYMMLCLTILFNPFSSCESDLSMPVNAILRHWKRAVGSKGIVMRKMMIYVLLIAPM